MSINQRNRIHKIKREPKQQSPPAITYYKTDSDSCSLIKTGNYTYRIFAPISQNQGILLFLYIQIRSDTNYINS